MAFEKPAFLTLVHYPQSLNFVRSSNSCGLSPVRFWHHHSWDQNFRRKNFFACPPMANLRTSLSCIESKEVMNFIFYILIRKVFFGWFVHEVTLQSGLVVKYLEHHDHWIDGIRIKKPFGAYRRLTPADTIRSYWLYKDTVEALPDSVSDFPEKIGDLTYISASGRYVDRFETETFSIDATDILEIAQNYYRIMKKIGESRYG